MTCILPISSYEPVDVTFHCTKIEVFHKGFLQ